MIRSLKEIRNKKCKSCELYREAEFVCLPGFGSDKAKIMFIGEAPGHREDDSGKPFVGRAGKVLDTILHELGLNRKRVYISNIVHCRPPQNRTPSMDEMRSCRKYLLKEIKIVNPKIIVTLGNSALKGLFDTNTMSIKKERGRLIEWDGRIILPTYHPAAALRNPYYGKLLYQDLCDGLKKAEFAQQSRGNLERKRQYTRVSSKNLSKVKKRLLGSKVMVCDVETTALDMFDLKEGMLYVGLTNKENSGYVFPTSPKFMKTVEEILNSVDLVIGHNIKFDLKWLMRYGVRVRKRLFDTQVAMHLIDENYPDKTLHHLALKKLSPDIAQYLDKWKRKFDEAKKGKEFSQDDWVAYNGGDVDATLQLYKVFKAKLKKEELLDLMKFEMRNLKVLAYMEYQGIKIHQKNLEKLKIEYSTRLEACEKTIKRALGDINLNSPKQLTEKLYKDLELPIIKRTAKNAPSCDEDTLTRLAKMRFKKSIKNMLQSLLDFRRLDKLKGTYIDGLIKNGLMKSDGKVHCNYKICGTVTGRLSCTKPNLQQIPREGDIKLMFRSSFKNGRIIQGDYSQAELRILAHYSGDKNLIEAFKKGRDIHQEVAAKVFKKPYDKVTPQERKYTKQVNFGIIYLISDEGLAEKIGCSKRTAGTLKIEWFKEFPDALKWIRRMKQKVVDFGYTENIFGRRRHFFATNPNRPEGRANQREGVNAPIQGAAGDLTKWVGSETHYRLKKAGLKARVIINVHDAVMIDSPRKEVKKAIKILRNVAVNPPVKLRVPMRMDIKVGPTWGELKEV